MQLLLSGDKSLRYRLNQKSYLVESGGNMDKKQRDLNEFVDSHESKIDWFGVVKELDENIRKQEHSKGANE